MGFHTNSLRAQEIPVPVQKRRVLTQSSSLHSPSTNRRHKFCLTFSGPTVLSTQLPSPNSAHETKCSGYSSQKHNSCHHSASANATLCEKSRTQMPQVKILIHSWHGSQWPTKVRHMLVSLRFFSILSSSIWNPRCFLFSFLLFCLGVLFSIFHEECFILYIIIIYHFLYIIHCNWGIQDIFSLSHKHLTNVQVTPSIQSAGMPE